MEDANVQITIETELDTEALEKLRGQVKRTQEAIAGVWRGIEGKMSLTLVGDAAEKFAAYAREHGVVLFQRRPPAHLSLAVQLKEHRAQRKRKKRHERRMLALGGRLLRQQGERIQGSHRRTVSEQFLLEWEDRAWSMARHEVIGRGEQHRDRIAYQVRCSQCGEWDPVQPCGKPCPSPEIPF